MKVSRMPRSIALACCVAAVCANAPQKAIADLVISVTDAGAGKTSFSLQGTIHTDTTTSFTKSYGPYDKFSALNHAGGDVLEWFWMPNVYMSGRDVNFRTFPLVSRPSGALSDPLDFDLGSPGSDRFLSGLSLPNNLQLTFEHDALFRIWGDSSSAPTSMTLDEVVVYDIDFGDFSPGVWEWGAPGGAVGDGITLSIVASVPEASQVALMGVVALLGIGYVKLRRK
ncbi:MAG: hypothetical protein KDA44_19760 [Planctomycetales bacterium]|nr:hypothetical protein [Planctomycetales bacterium]